MLVFIAGMPRSGSTFSFNVAREVLSRRGKTHHAAVASLAGIDTDAKHFILKAHDADEEMTRRIMAGDMKAIVTLRRRPEDAVASWMTAFGHGLDETLGVFRGWFAFYERIKPQALLVDYDEIDTRPAEAAGRIARHLVPEIGMTEVINLHRRFANAKADVFEKTHAMQAADAGVQDVGFSYYDTATFYHRRHVQSLTSRSASDILDAEQIGRIRRDLAPHIDGEGYLR